MYGSKRDALLPCVVETRPNRNKVVQAFEFHHSESGAFAALSSEEFVVQLQCKLQPLRNRRPARGMHDREPV